MPHGKKLVIRYDDRGSDGCGDALPAVLFVASKFTEAGCAPSPALG